MGKSVYALHGMYLPLSERSYRIWKAQQGAAEVYLSIIFP